LKHIDHSETHEERENEKRILNRGDPFLQVGDVQRTDQVGALHFDSSAKSSRENTHTTRERERESSTCYNLKEELVRARGGDRVGLVDRRHFADVCAALITLLAKPYTNEKIIKKSYIRKD
jgi:hypothetical protein